MKQQWVGAFLQMGRLERRALQFTVAAASLVPISAGAAGILLGPHMVNAIIATPADLDSHVRYLSGLLLGIGLGFASTIPHIEKRGRRFRLHTGIVILGGLGRLVSLHGPNLCEACHLHIVPTIAESGVEPMR